MDTEEHVGFLGGMSNNISKTVPYFADRNFEIIFHCPYLLHTEIADLDAVVVSAPVDESPIERRESRTARRSIAAIAASDASGENYRPKEESTRLSEPAEPPTSYQTVISDLMSDNLVHIVWIEDFKNAQSIPSKVNSFIHSHGSSARAAGKSGSSIFLFVHPLPHTQAVYWIKLLMCPSRFSSPIIPENLVN